MLCERTENVGRVAPQIQRTSRKIERRFVVFMFIAGPRIKIQAHSMRLAKMRLGFGSKYGRFGLGLMNFHRLWGQSRPPRTRVQRVIYGELESMRPFRFREGTPNEYSRLTDESLSGYLERTREVLGISDSYVIWRRSEVDSVVAFLLCLNRRYFNCTSC